MVIQEAAGPVIIGSAVHFIYHASQLISKLHRKDKPLFYMHNNSL